MKGHDQQHGTLLAACATSVEAMRPVRGALTQLAVLDPTRLNALVPFYLDIFSHCERECRKHEKKLTACKDCADACANLVNVLMTIA